MSPDAAVAEAVPPVETQEQPAEIAPVTEVQDEEPVGDSGAPEGGDEAEQEPEDPDEAILARLDEYAKENPKLAEKLRERLVQQPELKDEDWVNWAGQQAQVRQQRYAPVYQMASGYKPEHIDAATRKWVTEQFEKPTKAQLKAYADGQANSPEIDFSGKDQELSAYIKSAVSTNVTAQVARIEDTLMGALERTSIVRRLNDQEAGYIAQAENDPVPERRILTRVLAFLAAAERQPDSAKLKTELRKELESELGVQEKARKVLEVLPKGNRSIRQGANGSSNSLDAIEQRIADGIATTEDYKRYGELRPRQ